MLTQFHAVHMRFDAIQSELKDIKLLIGGIPQEAVLHNRVSQTEDHFDSFKRLTNRTSELPDFLNKCDNHPPEELIDYINRYQNNIVHSAGRNYDRVNVLRTQQELGIIMLTALKLYQACHGAKSANLPADQREQYINDKRITANELAEKIKSVMQTCYDTEDNIFKNFFTEHAKSEIDNFVAGIINKNTHDICKELYDHLSYKYYWRHFAVGIYSDAAVGHKAHHYIFNSNRAHVIFRQGGKSWFVLMSQFDEGDENFEQRVNKCYDDLINYQHIRNLVSDIGCEILSKDYDVTKSGFYGWHMTSDRYQYNRLRDCINQFDNLICVGDRFGLWLYWNDSHIFINRGIHEGNYGGFSIFATQ